MIVYITGDQIIDTLDNRIIESNFFIFKEAVRYCNRNGWRWYYLHMGDKLNGRELWNKLGNLLSPRLPERYIFDRSLHAEIYDTLVKMSTSYVPRPYLKIREILSALYKRGDGEFFGVWFVYHETGVYCSTGDNRVQLVWEPAEEENTLVQQAN